MERVPHEPKMRRHLKQQSRLEKKRELWRSKLDKPIGPGVLVTLIPTLIMCVFLILAAPYLKGILLKFFEMDREEVIRSIEVVEDGEPELPETPPPNPERAIAEIYQRQFDAEGFDWRTPPKIEIPEEKRPEIVKEIKPIPVEIPLTVTSPELESPLLDDSGPEG